ncbi:MAG: ABC transporter permease [Bacteroidota bacterium]|nr:ABC transporter permease [Bacteroidota bacterium]
MKTRQINSKSDSLIDYIKYICSYVDLIKVLTKRDIRVQYKNTLLGVGWALIVPLIQVVLISLVFSKTNLLQDSKLNSIIMITSGMSIWNVINSSINQAISNLSGQMVIITKVSFPRVILPLSAVLSRIIDSLIFLLIFFGIYFFFIGVGFMTVYWVYIPLIYAFTFVFALGFSILLSGLSMQFKDVKYLTIIILQVGLYVTPVGYSLHILPPHIQGIMQYWPPAIFIELLRIIISGESINFIVILPSVLISLGILIIAILYFKSLENKLADLV